MFFHNEDYQCLSLFWCVYVSGCLILLCGDDFGVSRFGGLFWAFFFFLSFGSCNLGSLNSFFVIFIFVRMSFGTFSSFILFFGCIFFLNFLLKFACLDR